MINISLKLFYQYIAIFFNFSPTSNHLHPLQVENCDSNSLRVVDEMTMVNSDSKGLSPHDALKHHFTSLKTDSIFLKLRFLK